MAKHSRAIAAQAVTIAGMRDSMAGWERADQGCMKHKGRRWAEARE